MIEHKQYLAGKCTRQTMRDRARGHYIRSNDWGEDSAEEDDSGERADLAARVKQLQRGSPEGKRQWWSFCDSEGLNRRDPSRHTVAFLRRFFAQRRY